MSPRKRKSQFLRALEARREEAARQQQPEEETSEPEAREATPPTRVLRERAPLLWPSKPRRRHWK